MVAQNGGAVMFTVSFRWAQAALRASLAVVSVLLLANSLPAQEPVEKTYAHSLETALIYLEVQQTKEARVFLNEALDLAASEQERAVVTRNLALADNIDGQYEDERKKLDQVLASEAVANDYKQVVQLQKAQSLDEQKRWGEAREEYGKLSNFGDSTPLLQLLVHRGIARTLRMEGKHDEGRAELDKVQTIEGAPASVRVQGVLDRGQSFVEQKRYEEARAEYAKVLNLTTENEEEEEAREVRSLQAVAQFRIAQTFFLAKEYAQAREEFGKVFKLKDAQDFFLLEAQKKILAIDEILKPEEQPEEQPK
jgi:tetratricopeptide (TPR) repeat protein